MRNFGVEPSPGNASTICWAVHSAVGFPVTLKWAIRRRSWDRTRKQIKSRNVTLGQDFLKPPGNSLENQDLLAQSEDPASRDARQPLIRSVLPERSVSRIDNPPPFWNAPPRSARRLHVLRREAPRARSILARPGTLARLQVDP